MNPPEIIRFPNDTALVDHAVAAFLREVSSAARGRPYRMALSGGRIAGRFFATLATRARAQSAVLESVDFFWADERCVPPTDSESNFALADQNLFAPLGIKPAQIHRIRGELLPDPAAAEAEADITKAIPLNPSGQPVFDLVHLGMGEDGHVASLFPNETPDRIESQRIYRAVVGPKPPPARVTLSYAALAAARQVWVIASGAGKQDALNRSLANPTDTPLGHLLSLHPRTTILTDLA